MPRNDEARRTRRPLLWLYAALSVAIVLVGYISYRDHEASLRADVGAQLKAIVNLKTGEISAWRSERIGDGEMLRGAPGFATLVGRVVHGPAQDAARDELLVWFEEIRAASGYTRVSLLDASGTRILSSPATSPTADPVLSSASVQAMRTGRVSITDFHRDDATADRIHLTVVAPIVHGEGSGRAVAVVALKIDPSVYLYPNIQQWPGDARTAETLLVERDGADALFLNELKYQKGAALTLRVPLTKTNMPAVQAALGRETIMDGVDYRGVPVVAATKRVPGTPWGVVARVDAAEVYAPLRTRLWVTVILVAGTLGSWFFGILLLLRMQAATLYRKQLEREVERAWLAAAIDNSLNEVYAFDAETLCFEYVNRGAIDNIGYTIEELRAITPLDIDIKPEFSEEAFRAMVGPLVSGERKALVFETVHRRKDGTEYPVVARLQLTERAGKRLFLAFANDITERRAAEADLAKYREHLELLVAERTEQLQDANEALGVSNEELATTNEELEATNEELEAMNEELEATNEELQTLNEEVAEAGRELERLNSELARADNAKSDFLASMSHELRTPLNSVIGFSDIMRNGLAGELNDEQQRQMEMINSSGKHLLLLINDVLDLSKVEAGRMESELERFDLSAEVLEVLETLRPQADARALNLSMTGAGEPFEIVSDSRMVRQILFNLLSNAIKFTELGAVQVSVTERDGLVEVAVTDTGPGIAHGDQRRIFDAFTQVRVHDGRPDGTGLGLAVSSRLAALLGGELSVRSEPGEGSTFTLTLPRTPASENGF